jgi:small subunit ribosomal protein S1
MSENQDFASMLAAFDLEQAEVRRPAPKVGAKISGTVLSIGAEVAFVDIGDKAEGVLPVEEMCDSEGDLAYAVGDSIEALVSGQDPAGAWLLRLRPGRGETLPEEIRAAQEHGLPVEGMVTGVNKGGAEVQVAGLRAFCPMSQLDSRYVEDPAVFVGQRLRFRVTKFEAGGQGRSANLVLSRRALLEEEAAKLAEETRKTLEVGAVVRGTITSIASFGAFVDLGGIDGLLHVSEMSYQRVEDPKELFTVGQEVEVQVVKIERRESGDEERVSLSLKSLTPDPWTRAAELFRVGSAVSGTVVKLEPFGAFIEVGSGIQGLAHVSELGQSQRVHHARDVLSVGQRVEAKVLDIDLERKRLSLSLSALRADATAAAEAADKQAFDQRQEGSSGFGSLADFFPGKRS